MRRQRSRPTIPSTWGDDLRLCAVMLVLLVGWIAAVRSGWDQGGILGAIVAGIAGLVVVPLAALIGWIVLWNLVELLCLPGTLLARRLEWRPDTHPLGRLGLQLASLLLFGSIAYPLLRAVPDWLAWSLFGGIACVIFTIGSLILLFIALLLRGRGIRKGPFVVRYGSVSFGGGQAEPAGRFRDDSDPDDPGGPVLEVEPEPTPPRRLPPPDAPAGG